jgi:hypothetical protein
MDGKCLISLARPPRFERGTCGFEARSIHEQNQGLRWVTAPNSAKLRRPLAQSQHSPRA